MCIGIWGCTDRKSPEPHILDSAVDVGLPDGGAFALDPCASTDCGEGECVVTVDQQPLCLCDRKMGLRRECSTECVAYPETTEFVAQKSHMVTLEVSFAGVPILPQPIGIPISVHLRKIDELSFARTSSIPPGGLGPQFDLENGRPQPIPEGIYRVEWNWEKNTGPEGYEGAILWAPDFGYLKVRQDKTFSVDFPRLVPVEGVIDYPTDWGQNFSGRLVGQRGSFFLRSERSHPVFTFNNVDGTFKGVLPEGRYDLFVDSFAPRDLPIVREPLVCDAIEIRHRDTIVNARIKIPTHKIGLTINLDETFDVGLPPRCTSCVGLKSEQFESFPHQINATRWEAFVPSGTYKLSTYAGVFEIKVPESLEFDFSFRSIPAAIQVLVDGVPAEPTQDFSFGVEGLRFAKHQGNGRFTGSVWEGVPTPFSISVRTGSRYSYPHGTHTFKEGSPPLTLSINTVRANLSVGLSASQLPSKSGLVVHPMVPGGSERPADAVLLPLTGDVVLPHGMYSIWYRDEAHFFEIGKTRFDAEHTSYTHTVSLLNVAMRATINGTPAGTLDVGPRKFRFWGRHPSTDGASGEVAESGNFNFTVVKGEYVGWVEGLGVRCFAIEASR